MTDRPAFLPNWVSPPGDTIADALEARGWTPGELAQQLGATPEHVSALLRGEASLSPEVGEGLSRVLGSTPAFWLTREARYRAAVVRLAAGAATG
jgi:HTH-type transcriptional regulator/antitoxin HigA